MVTSPQLPMRVLTSGAGCWADLVPPPGPRWPFPSPTPWSRRCCRGSFPGKNEAPKWEENAPKWHQDWEIGWDSGQNKQKDGHTLQKSVYLDPCLAGNQWKLHPSVKIYLPKYNLPRPSGGGFSPLADLSKHEHSQLLKTISNWVSEHPRVTRCHKKNWKMIKPCMDGRTRPTWLISHQLWCSPAGGEKKRNKWAAPLVQRLRAIGENLEDKQRCIKVYGDHCWHKSEHKYLRVPCKGSWYLMIFSPVLCSSIMREKELTQPPPIHQLVCADVVWGYSIFTGW